MYTPASVGKTGILKVKKSNAEQLKYRPDLGDVDLDISSELNTNTTGQFSTITGGLMESCVINLEPVQSGSGTPSPDNVRLITGHSSVEVRNHKKNYINQSNASNIVIPNGNTRNGLHLNLRSGTYTASLDSTSPIKFYGRYKGKSENTFHAADAEPGLSSTFTLTEDGEIYLYVASGKLFTELVNPMLEEGSRATTYEPYQGQDITISLGQTVYGGSVDVVSGVLTVDRGYVDLGSIEWTRGNTGTTGAYRFTSITLPNVKPTSSNSDIPNAICSKYKTVSPSDTYRCVEGATITTGGGINLYVDAYKTETAENFKTAMNGVQFVYELATPIIIQLTPTQIETLVGENNVTTPLEKQSLNSLEYRDIMSWEDVSDNFKVYMNSVSDNSFTFSQGDSTTSVTIIDHSRAKAECLAYINAQEGMVTPDMAYKAYAVGEHFMHKGKFCTAITAIAQGDMLVANTNYVEGTIADYITSKDITSELTWNSSGNTFAHYSASISGNVVTINVRFSATIVSANHVLVEIPDKYMPKSGWHFGMIMKSWYGTPISAVVYKLPSSTGQLYLPDVTTFETGVGYVGSFTYII